MAYRGQEFAVRDLTKVWPSSCSGVTRSWSFGDGFTSNEKNPRHVYENLGVYALSLTLEWSNCVDKMTKVVNVEVRDHPPVAQLEPLSGPFVAGTAIALDASRSRDPDGSIATYLVRVDGKDKLSTSQPTFTITVNQAGRHLLELIVIDAAGNPAARPATTTLDIVPGPARTVQIAPAGTTLPVDTNTMFSSRAFDAFGNQATGSPTWSATCGQIDENGVFHAPTFAGDCGVVAHWGNEQAKANANITPGPVANLTIFPQDPEAAVGAVMRFYAQGTDVFGNAQKVDVSWSVTCGDITPDGEYTASHSIGVCSVTAAYDKIRTSTDVLTKESALFRVEITPAYAQLRGHETQNFTVIGFDAYDNQVPVYGNFVSDCGYFVHGGQFVAPDVGFTCHIGIENVQNGFATVDVFEPSAPVPELGPLALASVGAVFLALFSLRRRGA